MEDEAINKARLEGGLEAFGTPRDAHDDKTAKYSDTPMMGRRRSPQALPKG